MAEKKKSVVKPMQYFFEKKEVSDDDFYKLVVEALGKSLNDSPNQTSRRVAKSAVLGMGYKKGDKNGC